MGHWFEAKRNGRCAHCPKPIAAGDEVYAKSAGVYLCHDCGLLADNLPTDVGEHETAVMKELAKLPMEASEGILAQSMLGLSRDLDAGDVPPRERTQYTKELRIGLRKFVSGRDCRAPSDTASDARSCSCEISPLSTG